jgi:peptide/nickel transport system permease protein
MAERAPAVPAVEVFKPKRRLPWYIECWPRLVKEKPLGTVGGVITLLLLFTGVFANFIAPYGMNETHLNERLQPYSMKHLLGTDALGRDMLSRIIFGARISMYVGLGTTAISTVGRTLIGLTTGYFGGWWDIIMQRIVDAWMCFPWLVILLTIMALLGPGLLNIIFALSLSGTFAGSRVMRGATIGIKENQYVEAARAIGCTPTRVLLVYILPNVMAPLIIAGTVALGGIILAEASLSFLGFGIPPPAPSWGGMLSGSGRTYMYTAPWMAIWPGVALSLVVFGFNMLGDGLRDVLDPRLRGAQGARFGASVVAAMR